MPSHFLCRQSEVPVANRLWKCLTGGQPHLPPVLVDDVAECVAGMHPWLPNTGDRANGFGTGQKRLRAWDDTGQAGTSLGCDVEMIVPNRLPALPHNIGNKATTAVWLIEVF